MSIDFKKSNPIYVQIAYQIHDKVLLGEYPEETKILSIREQAIKFEVNPNTVQRSYELLQQQELIYTKRGLGYFISPGAKEKIKILRKERFIALELPVIFKNMLLLDMNEADLIRYLEDYKKTIKQKNA